MLPLEGTDTDPKLSLSLNERMLCRRGAVPLENIGPKTHT